MTWEHKIYLSDGRCMTGAEFDAAIVSGEIIKRGEALWAKDVMANFKEKQDISHVIAASRIPTDQ